MENLKHTDLGPAIAEQARLFKKYDLSYDQVKYVIRQARKKINQTPPPIKRKVIARLSPKEQRQLIEYAYDQTGHKGLMIKTLLQTGSRVEAFTRIEVSDFNFEEKFILIKTDKGGKGREVPITESLAQEIRTYLNGRKNGHLFESNRLSRYSKRAVQKIVKQTAKGAGIAKNVYCHLLRHTQASLLHEKGMPIEKIQKFLGHENIQTTTHYLANLACSMREDFDQAMK